MANYENMRDSGVKWIGYAPSHWEILSARKSFVQSFEKGNTTPILLSASQKYGMCPQENLEGTVKVSEKVNLQDFKTVHKNDFVISLRSFQGGFERSDFEGVCSPAYQVFRAVRNYNNDYLKWLFKNSMFIEEINSITLGIREGKNIKYEDFAKVLLPVPPLAEQTAIANYLDKVCAQIDDIVEETKKSAEDYKKLRLSVITEAVTGGLDKNAEMKDSGVEWIGKVPKGWKIVPLKYTGNFDNGLTYSPKDLTDNSGILVIRSSNIQNDKLDFNDCVYVKNAPAHLMVKSKDIIICSRNGSAELVGKCGIIENELSATFGAFMMRYKPQDIYYKFSFYMLQTAIKSYKKLFATSIYSALKFCKNLYFLLQNM